MNDNAPVEIKTEGIQLGRLRRLADSINILDTIEPKPDVRYEVWVGDKSNPHATKSSLLNEIAEINARRKELIASLLS